MAMMDIQIDTELASVIDQTAMILVSMKNDPTPPSSPVPSALSPRHHHPHALRAGSPCTIIQPSNKNESCECMLCTRSAPIILSKCHTWAWIMRVVFYSLRERYPEKKFFSLKNDVYEYMMNHWNVLGLDRKPSANWHKQIQDMLSHSRNIFESGMTHFKQNGFWRLKDLEDPWTARPDTPRPPSTTPPLTPSSQTLIPSSPRKRVWKTTHSEEEDEEESVQATLKKLCTPPTSPRLSLHVHEALSSPSSTSSLSSACSSRPSSPLSDATSTPPFYNPLSSSTSSLKASEEMEREVAILREQLNHMTAQLSESPTPLSSPSPSPSPTPLSSSSPSPSPSPTPSSQFKPAVFSHNRVWEEAAAPVYSYQQFPTVQA
eukprot:Phypoly_transcript_10202.p1 GENE.Phypoly_transcript_10202~~Phypoly_transcript_10202.p1  ORF type:complete len:420 (+),score=142.21 Phypoly_transcript_10202:138-1262(+)